jgi:hypothetical protein
MSEERPRPRVSIRGVLLFSVAIAAALVAIDLAERFVLYEIRERDRRSFPRMVRRPIKDTALALMHGLLPKRIPGDADVPVFDFYFKPRDAEALLAKLTRVRIVGTHDESTRLWVPARMRVGGETFDARVKLRGRQHYHVIPPRPSLRVKLRRGRTYRGTNTFNLIDPFDKTTDQVFLWEAASQGLVDWDATLGVLSIGGEPLAVVQYVEQLRRPTGDRTGRSEGMFFRGTGEHYTEGMDPERCGASVARMAEWLADTTMTVPFEPLAEIADLDRFRWFTALTELSGDGHGFANFNTKAYCEPFAAKIEFVTWDTRFGDWETLPKRDFADEGGQFLRNDRYRLLHDETLHFLARERLEPMLERMRTFHGLHGALLARDPMFWFPRSGPDGGFMRNRLAKLEATLRRNAAAILATLEGDQLAWHLDAPHRRLLLQTEDRGAKRVDALVLRGGGTHLLADPLVVHGRYREHRPLVILPLPQGIDPGDVTDIVARRIHGGGSVAAHRLEEPPQGTPVWPREEEGGPLPPLPDGFEVDVAAREIRVGPGRVRIEGALLLPRGWAVTVAPGTAIEAGPDALLEVRADLIMRGTARAPISIGGSLARPWDAIAVLGERTAPVRVEISHTTVRGGRGSNQGSSLYTGSLSIYYADVRLDRLTIEEGAADDAINLKYCTFDARDCVYRDGAGDAVDYDFSAGSDRRTLVERFPDDGIDISGADVVIEGARIRDVGDKALSIGEGSRPRITDVEVVGANTGCAVKDRSDALVEDLTVVRADTAVALYTKKPSFGPSRARFDGLTAVDVEGLTIVDAGSEVRFRRAVRIGADTSRMRAFEGVRNLTRPGLEEMTVEELLALAERSRGGMAASDPSGQWTGNLARTREARGTHLLPEGP